MSHLQEGVGPVRAPESLYASVSHISPKDRADKSHGKVFFKDGPDLFDENSKT